MLSKNKKIESNLIKKFSYRHITNYFYFHGGFQKNSN
jgi:hypothetical protein